MRMTTEQKNAKQSNAIEMAKQGLTQKEIAQQLNITEKTAGKWLKAFKEDKTAQTNILRLFDKQLTKMLKTETPNILEIERLTKAMNEYKKGLFA